MALRETITEFEVDNIKAKVHLDTGMGFGQECWITAEGEDWRIQRTFWFGSYNEHHARNFVQKLARDENYRKHCINRETEWAQVSDAAKETARALSGIASKHDAWEEIEQIAEEMYQAMKNAKPNEFGDVRDRFVNRAEERAEALGPEALDVDTEIGFGKHEGKTLLEIAREHTGYAEWGAEELDNRPEVQMGLGKALDLVGDKDDS